MTGPGEGRSWGREVLGKGGPGEGRHGGRSDGVAAGRAGPGEGGTVGGLMGWRVLMESGRETRVVYMYS